MINNYYNYLRNFLTIIATFFVFGNAGAQDIQYDPTSNTPIDNNYGGKTLNVTITRTFVGGKTEAIFFPFSISNSVLNTKFGNGNYELWYFESVNNGKFTFKKMDTPEITAGTPYIIRVTQTVENPDFNSVTITSTPNDFAMKTTSPNEEGFLIKGFYYMTAWYDVIEKQSSPYTGYFLSNRGLATTDLRNDGIQNYAGSTFCFITKDGTKPTIEIEGISSGSGEGGGGTETPTYTDVSGTIKLKLTEKIANREQLTNVPTIYLDIPDVTTINTDLAKVTDPETGDAKYFKASIQVIDNSEAGTPQHLTSFTETELEIKVRGNSTSTAAKRPYRLKFAKKHKHDLLGYGYEKRNWTLLANAFDGSMMRNAITYHLGKYVGLDKGAGFCPGYKFVDLVINGDYRGTYQVSDHVQVDGDRININEDTDWFLEGVAWSNQAEEPYVGQEPSICIKNPEPETEEEITALKSEVNAWRTQWLAAFDSMDPNTGWQAMNDVESFIKYYIAVNLTGDIDSWFVFKGYRTPTGPFFWGPLWDKDLAFGNWSQADPKKLVEFYGKCNFEWKIQALLSQRAFVEKALECINTLINEGLESKLDADIDRIAGILEETQKLNYQLYDITAMGSGYIQKSTYAEYVAQLKDYIHNRITFVQSELQKYVNNLPAPTEDTYNPENYWWGTGLSLNKEYNLSISNRTLEGGKWNTFCLPFAATEAQMKTALGCNYELAIHSGMASDGETMQFSAPETLDIQAGIPYLIKPASDVTSFGNFNGVFYTQNVTHVSGQEYNGHSVTFDNKHYFYASLFHGYELSKTTDYLFNNDLYTTNDASFTKTTATDQKGCRAFIRITEGNSTPKIEFVEDTPPVVRTQLTNLPTIYIDTKDNAAINPSSGDWTQAGIQVIDENNKLKPFVYAADAVTAKGKPVFQIRGRGAASWTNAEKKSYRIQFGKDDKDELGNVTTSYKHYLLGDEDAAGVVKKRNWVLLANAGDKTLVRNALTKKIGDIVGLPFTPGYQFVDLVLNGTYVGTYQVTEFIEADANRVNIDEDNGLLIQMTGQADTSTGDHIIAGTDSKPYLTIKNPEIKTANQAAWNAAFNTAIYDFDGMWSATNGTGLDRETLVNWYIASEITGNYEALSSIYAYLDATTKNLCFGPLWNNETAFDNHASINMTSAGLMNDAETDATHNGLLTQAGKDAAWKTKLEELWTRKWFAAAVYDRWKVLYNNGSLTTTLTGIVDELAAIVNNNTKSSQALNFRPAADGGAGWTITGQGITGYSKDVTNSAYADEVLRLKTYLEQRLPYLDKKFKILGEVDGPEITIGTGGYSSFSWDGALDFNGTGVEVYVATSYVKGILQLEKVADGKIPAETGVILKGNEGDKIYPQTISENVSLTATNILLNTAKDTFTVPSENSYYALATLNGKTALYKIQSGITIPLYKAYLSVASQQAPAAIFFGDIDGGTTGLNEISVNADSQHEAVYNLQGRRMKGNLAKGIYIKNGKKFIVK